MVGRERLTKTKKMNDTTKAQEVLFYARCQLEGMIAKNQFLTGRGIEIEYTEEDFAQLAEDTRHAYQEAMR